MDVLEEAKERVLQLCGRKQQMKIVVACNYRQGISRCGDCVAVSQTNATAFLG
jgi:hypothetical protein